MGEKYQNKNYSSIQEQKEDVQTERKKDGIKLKAQRRKEETEPKGMTERQMEAERRWLAPGVRSHRWAKRPPVNGGVLKDRA